MSYILGLLLEAEACDQIKSSVLFSWLEEVQLCESRSDEMIKAGSKESKSRSKQLNFGPWPCCTTYKWWGSTPRACRRMEQEVRERLSQGQQANCRQVISLPSLPPLDALDELQGEHNNGHSIILTVHSSWPRCRSTHWYLSSLAAFRGSTSAANSRFSSAYSWPERKPVDTPSKWKNQHVWPGFSVNSEQTST